jgi:glutathione peroxidase
MYQKMHMDADAFPVLDKVYVNGEHTVPFYRFLKTQKPEAIGGILEPTKKIQGETPFGELSWNYEKFFVNETGGVVGRYSHAKDVKDLEDWIKEQLAL